MVHTRLRTRHKNVPSMHGSCTRAYKTQKCA
ncbi:hypothetical protein ACJIZ3_015838 [Penstemon smallii]|uniref:Uncharacterized protein n=1 Tax=Penstemon smallii TaxID=265156 RepID=A0ABD3RNR8_9LAMI